MVPVRVVALVLAVKAHVVVPVLLPLEPDVMESQLLPEVTAAVHGMVPVPVLDILNVVVPDALETLRLSGVAESIEPGCSVYNCLTSSSDSARL